MSTGGSDRESVVITSGESEATITWDDLDLLTRAFAERQVGLIYSVTNGLGSNDATAEQRLAASRLLADFATNMYNIAATENAFTRVLDFCVVTALLNREWSDDGRAEEVFGESGSRLIRAFADAAVDAKDLGSLVLNAEQLSSLDQLIDDWTEENELVDRASFMRFSQFAVGRDRPEADRLLGLGATFFSSIAETGEAVDRATRLADRVFYRFEHASTLARWQTAAVKADALATPEIDRALEQMSALSERLDTLPGEIGGAIKSVLTALDERLPEIDATIESVRGVVTEADELAASVESAGASVRRAIQAGSSLMESSDQGQNGSPDIARYERAAEGIGDAAARVRLAAESIDKLLGSSPAQSGAGAFAGAVEGQIEAATNAADGLIETTFWRLVALLGVFFALLLIYRAVSIWMVRRYGPAGYPHAAKQ